MDHLFVLQASQISPKDTKSGPKGPKTSPIGTIFPLFFRSFLVLEARWGPMGILGQPSDAQGAQNQLKSDPRRA